MPRPKWDEEVEMSDELYSELPYSASDIQDYFEYMAKNMKNLLKTHEFKYALKKLKI